MTKPHLDRVVFKDTGGDTHVCNSSQRLKPKIPAEILRVKECLSVYPGEYFTSQLSSNFSSIKKVFVSPRKEALINGMQPGFLNVSKDGSIGILNNSENVWTLKKNQHLADIRQAISSEEARIATTKLLYGYLII